MVLLSEFFEKVDLKRKKNSERQRVCHFPIGILGQAWYLIVSIPDLCTRTYFYKLSNEILLFISYASSKRLEPA